MVTAQSSLNIVSSSTGSANEPICGVSELSDKVLIDEDELVNSLSDTKENSQMEVNSLDNSPSSTTSSKKLHVSPIAVRHHMTNSHEACDGGHAPTYEQLHDNISLASFRPCDIPMRRPSHDMFVSSTTNVDLGDAPILQKALSQSQVTSSGDAPQKTDLLMYNGAYQAIEMGSIEADSCSSKLEVTDLNVTKSDQVEDTKFIGSGSTSACMSMPVDLVDETSQKDLNIPSDCDADKPRSSMSEEKINSDNEKITPSEDTDISETELAKKKFPDSFEELMVMHFQRELNVAEMVESMSCLERDNQVHETELTRLMDQVSLLQNINKQLDGGMKP